ncbi:hypothetical protein BB561_000398 [Smittium simulii]|uniref:Uncharacterized protein n=1 Tax=Smittium simulii TaxID=133385 RepID=A0A2T9YZG2_9FUNG|nr:hypothetical protein BB561_000398 [Smittium simulii]
MSGSSSFGSYSFDSIDGSFDNKMAEIDGYFSEHNSELDKPAEYILNNNVNRFQTYDPPEPSLKVLTKSVPQQSLKPPALKSTLLKNNSIITNKPDRLNYLSNFGNNPNNIKRISRIRPSSETEIHHFSSKDVSANRKYHSEESSLSGTSIDLNRPFTNFHNQPLFNSENDNYLASSNNIINNVSEPHKPEHIEYPIDRNLISKQSYSNNMFSENKLNSNKFEQIKLGNTSINNVTFSDSIDGSFKYHDHNRIVSLNNNENKLNGIDLSQEHNFKYSTNPTTTVKNNNLAMDFKNFNPEYSNEDFANRSTIQINGYDDSIQYPNTSKMSIFNSEIHSINDNASYSFNVFTPINKPRVISKNITSDKSLKRPPNQKSKLNDHSKNSKLSDFKQYNTNNINIAQNAKKSAVGSNNAFHTSTNNVFHAIPQTLQNVKSSQAQNNLAIPENTQNLQTINGLKNTFFTADIVSKSSNHSSLSFTKDIPKAVFMGNDRGPPSSLFGSAISNHDDEGFEAYYNNSKMEKESFIYHQNDANKMSNLLTKQNINLPPLPKQNIVTDVQTSSDLITHGAINNGSSNQIDSSLKDLTFSDKNSTLESKPDPILAVTELDSKDLKELQEYAPNTNTQSNLDNFNANQNENNSLNESEIHIPKAFTKKVRMASQNEFIQREMSFISHNTSIGSNNSIAYVDPIDGMSDADKSFEESNSDININPSDNMKSTLNYNFEIPSESHEFLIKKLDYTKANAAAPTLDAQILSDIGISGIDVLKTPSNLTKIKGSNSPITTSANKSVKSLNYGSIISDNFSRSSPHDDKTSNILHMSSNAVSKAFDAIKEDDNGNHINLLNQIKNLSRAELNQESLLNYPVDCPTVNSATLPKFFEVDLKPTNNRVSSIGLFNPVKTADIAVGTTPTSMKLTENGNSNHPSQFSTPSQVNNEDKSTKVNSNLRYQSSTLNTQQSNNSTPTNNLAPTPNKLVNSTDQKSLFKMASHGNYIRNNIAQNNSNVNTNITSNSLNRTNTSEIDSTFQHQNYNNNSNSVPNQPSSEKKSKYLGIYSSSITPILLKKPQDTCISSNTNPISDNIDQTNNTITLPADQNKNKKFYNTQNTTNSNENKLAENQTKSNERLNSTPKTNATVANSMNTNLAKNMDMTENIHQSFKTPSKVNSENTQSCEKSTYKIQLTPSRETDKFLILSEDQIHKIAILIQSRLENSLHSLLELDRNILQNDIATVKDEALKSTELYNQIRNEIELDNRNESSQKFSNSIYCKDENKTQSFKPSYFSQQDPNASIQSTVEVGSSSTITVNQVEAVLESYRSELKRLISVNKAITADIFVKNSLQDNLKNNIYSQDVNTLEWINSNKNQYLNPANIDTGKKKNINRVISANQTDNSSNVSKKHSESINEDINKHNLTRQKSDYSAKNDVPLNSINHNINQNSSDHNNGFKITREKETNPIENHSFVDNNQHNDFNDNSDKPEKTNNNETNSDQTNLAENLNKLLIFVEDLHGGNPDEFHQSLIQNSQFASNCPICNIAISDLVEDFKNVSASIRKSAIDSKPTPPNNFSNADNYTSYQKYSFEHNNVSENNSQYEFKNSNYSTPIIRELRNINDLNHKFNLQKNQMDSTFNKPKNINPNIKKASKSSFIEPKTNLYSYKHSDKKINNLLGRWQSWFIESDPDLTATDASAYNNEKYNRMLTKTFNKPQPKKHTNFDSRQTANSGTNIYASMAFRDDRNYHNKDDRDVHYSESDTSESKSFLEQRLDKAQINANNFKSSKENNVFSNNMNTKSNFKAHQTREKASKLVIKLLLDELKTLHSKHNQLSKQLEYLNPADYNQNIERRQLSCDLKNIQGLIDIKSEEISILSAL